MLVITEKFLSELTSPIFPTITYTTNGKGKFKVGGRNGLPKMEEEMGFRPEAIEIVTTKRVMITPKNYHDVLVAIREKEIKEVALEEQFQYDDVELQLAIKKVSEKLIEVVDSVQAKKRSNGTTINGALAMSSKDNAPMLTFYEPFKGSTNKILINGIPATEEQISKLKTWGNVPKARMSSTQVQMGLSKPIIPKSKRLEDIIQ